MSLICISFFNSSNKGTEKHSYLPKKILKVNMKNLYISVLIVAHTENIIVHY